MWEGLKEVHGEKGVIGMWSAGGVYPQKDGVKIIVNEKISRSKDLGLDNSISRENYGEGNPAVVLTLTDEQLKTALDYVSAKVVEKDINARSGGWVTRDDINISSNLSDDPHFQSNDDGRKSWSSRSSRMSRLENGEGGGRGL